MTLTSFISLTSESLCSVKNSVCHKFLLLYWIQIIFHTFVNNSTLRHCIEVRSSLTIDLHVLLSVTSFYTLVIQLLCPLLLQHDSISLFRRISKKRKRKRSVSYVNISIVPLNKLTIDKFAKSHEPCQKYVYMCPFDYKAVVVSGKVEHSSTGSTTPVGWLLLLLLTVLSQSAIVV